MSGAGPLVGVRVLEFAAIGPVPFAAMLLHQMGAQVLRIERPGGDPLRPSTPHDYLNNGRPTMALDLKQESDRAMAADLAVHADIVIEGFRPGVMERLGLGPGDLRAANAALVYGRMTGWGQEGPLAPQPGHDINYLALTGALHAIGELGGVPVPPLNLVADFGGGAMFLIAGVLAAVIEARTTGCGRTVDAAMVDGAAALMTLQYGLFADGYATDRRGDNRLDGAHPCYATYETRDGKHVAVGALEPQFYAALLEGLGVAGTELPDRADKVNWPVLKALFAGRFAAETRAHWEQVFGGTAACVTPVLSMTEAPTHPHAIARGGFREDAGAFRPGAAPRFSPAELPPVAAWPLTGAQRARMS